MFAIIVLLIIPVFGQSDGSPAYIISLIEELRNLLSSGEKVGTEDLFNQYVFIITGFLAMLSTYLTHYWGWWRKSKLDGYLRHLSVVVVFILLLAIGRLDMDFNSIISILGSSGIFSIIYVLIKQWVGVDNKTLQK